MVESPSQRKILSDTADTEEAEMMMMEPQLPPIDQLEEGHNNTSAIQPPTSLVAAAAGDRQDIGMAIHPTCNNAAAAIVQAQEQGLGISNTNGDDDGQQKMAGVVGTSTGGIQQRAQTQQETDCNHIDKEANQTQGQPGNSGYYDTDRGQAKLAKLEAHSGRTQPNTNIVHHMVPPIVTDGDRRQARFAKLALQWQALQTGRSLHSTRQQQQQIERERLRPRANRAVAVEVGVSTASSSSVVSVVSSSDVAAESTTNSSNPNQAVTLRKIGLSKNSPQNRANRAFQPGAVAVSASTSSTTGGNDTTPSATQSRDSATAQETLTVTADTVAATRQSNNTSNTTTTTTTTTNGLSKKTPKAKARAAQAGAIVVSSSGDNQVATAIASGIIPPLRGLGKNPPTTQPAQQQQQRSPNRTKRGLRQNRQNRPGSQNQNQNEASSSSGSEGTNDDDEEQQANDATVEDTSFLPSSLDASPSLQNPQTEEFVSSSLSQPQDERAAPNLSPSAALQRGDTKLVVARAITDDSAVLMEAQEVDAEELERKTIEKKKNRHCIIVGLVLILASIGTLFGAIFGRPTTTTDEISVPFLAPSHSQSSAPSSALDFLLEALPEQTRQNICCNTPQYKAWEWLMNHKNISNLEEWRKKQLFALATFYYSFEGDNWYEPIRERWVDYEKGECLWFSNGFEYFDRDGYYRPWESINATCNEDGEFTSLYLRDLHLSGFAPSMPPEIALLTSLSAIDLRGNGITAPLSAMFPSELGQLTNLTVVDFGLNELSGPLPSELGLITSLTLLWLFDNAVGGPLPRELGLMTSLTRLELEGNAFSGQLPSELGLMTSLTKLLLDGNALTGQLPSEMGLMTSLTSLWLANNSLAGQLPSELGLMTNLTSLHLNDNVFTGIIPAELIALTSTTYVNLQGNSNFTLPTEIGLLTDVRRIDLNHHNLGGLVPSELGAMTSLTRLYLSDNALTGSIPSQLALITNLGLLRLENNTLNGNIPSQLQSLVVNGSLTVLTLANNSLSGTVPEALCSLGVLDAVLDHNRGMGLSFDCSDQLCGCCWCPCQESNYTNYCQTNPIYLSDEEWPGQFPSPVKGSNAITINIRSDKYPYKNSFGWSRQHESGVWEVPESEILTNKNSLHNYTKEVESDSIYRLQIFDSFGAGIEKGWFTITNSTPSPNHTNGTVMWDAVGDALEHSLEVFIWVDSNGHAQPVEYIPGNGYALEGEQFIVDPEIAEHETP